MTAAGDGRRRAGTRDGRVPEVGRRKAAAAAACPLSWRWRDCRRRPRCGPASGGDGVRWCGNGVGGKSEHQMRGEVDLVRPGFSYVAR